MLVFETPLWVVICAVLLISLYLCIVLFLPRKRRYGQRWRIISANRALLTLSRIHSPAQQLSYVRKVDPFVFEEMLLTAFKRLGYKIKRNTAYTGDGGIDGQVRINGQWMLVQAKRYRGYISASDVTAFSRLCAKSKSKGYFIHTGLTGKQSHVNAGKNVRIISGDALLDMLCPK